ncbi:MAG TPA: ISKra4 family transposase [Syntrophobacteraceae bacterium]|nr:ISKra4 family transposase [Syntrophobacteraceae bacterium]
MVRPFSHSAKVRSRGYSTPLQRRITDFGADVPFGKIANKFKEHYGIDVPITTACRITEAHGEKVAGLQERLHEIPETRGAEYVVAEMDGSMIPVVATGQSSQSSGCHDRRKDRRVEWKEARLTLAHSKGCVSPVYGVTLGGADQAGDLLLDCAIRAGCGAITRVHCVGDGAQWIADQVSRVFALQADCLIDFSHLCEYLAAAAPVCAPAAPKEWVEQQKTKMKDNQVSQVLEILEKHKEPESAAKDAPVRKCYQYISNRQHQFDYKGALKADLPIGSGEVESGHRYIIQDRLKRPGAWWKKENANSMLALRVLRANHGWDAYWDSQFQHAA